LAPEWCRCPKRQRKTQFARQVIPFDRKGANDGQIDKKTMDNGGDWNALFAR
jgi:hypothetical protein